MPALIFSIIISDAPFVASGYAFKQVGNIKVNQILNGDIKSLQGAPLTAFILTILIVFALAILNIFLLNKNRGEYLSEVVDREDKHLNS